MALQQTDKHDQLARLTDAFVRFSKEEIEQSISSRFEKQVSRVPDKLAVKTDGGQLTYLELNRYANRVAHALLSSGGSQQGSVALLLDQGIAMVASILGTLKAGRIYVPMDPSDPGARLSSVVNESESTTLLTDARNSPLAQSLTPRGGVLNVEKLDEHLPDTNLALDISPAANAYIFFTSGSTGKPKGVVDTHRNVLHNIMRYTNNLHITESDQLTLLQSASFSGSVSSLFCALLNGATVYPYDIRRQGMGSPLATWLSKEEITVYHSVPAIFRSFLYGDVRFPSIRIIRLEGDVASKLDVELFKKYFSSHCMLVHGLGATETGISRQYFINQTTQLAGAIVPVGYPTEDMDAILLDANGREVGIDTVGEIVVRSKYLAAGYWNNPELTSQAFAAAGDGVRMYRTGDMGLIRADGCLEYLGRKDFQLKIKGHKVEAAEVESALLEIGAVKEAVVTTREDRKGEPRLVAYIVARNAAPPSTKFLRSVLAEKLPEYMVPTRFVMLDALPLNANLKVDRRLLPPPDVIARDVQTPFVPSRTPEEATLADIWEDILDVHPIGATDNFFDLGGDSLAIVKLLIQIEQRFDRELAPGTIVQSPTVEELAEVVRSGRPSSCLVALQPVGLNAPLFCVPAHDGNVLVYASLARHLGSERPFYALQPVGMSGDEEPLTSIEKMATKYIGEVRRKCPQGPYYLGGFCFGGLIALEMAQQLASAGEEIALLALFDMNPGEMPRMVTKEILGEYRRHQAMRRRQQWKERFESRRFHYVALGIGRALRRKSKRVVWRLVHLWQEVTAQPMPKMFWDVGLGNDYAFEKYSPRPFAGRITLFLAEKTTRAYTDNPSHAWKDIAADVETYLVPGEEGGMLREPDVEILAEKLRACIEC